MKYFYDTEFLEGTQKKNILGFRYGKTLPTIDLISIGIVSEDNREYYAVCNEFNLDEAWNRYDLNYGSGDQKNRPTQRVYWIRENVLKPIYKDWIDEYNGKIVRLGLPLSLWKENRFTYKEFKKLLERYGKSKVQIAEEVKSFVYYTGWEVDPPIHAQKLKEKGDIQLYGYYSAYDHVALCWLFGKMIDLPKGFPMYTRDLKQMLDEKVESYEDRFMNGNESFEWKLKSIKNKDNYPKETNAHNALADAKWDKELYNFIQSL